MNIVIQHIGTRLYLGPNGSWVKLDAEPLTFQSPITAIGQCIHLAVRTVRLVMQAGAEGKERFFYPFGGDPAIKVEKKKLRRELAENRRLIQQRRVLLAHIDSLQAEVKERKKQLPFKRQKVSED